MGGSPTCRRSARTASSCYELEPDREQRRTRPPRRARIRTRASARVTCASRRTKDALRGERIPRDGRRVRNAIARRAGCGRRRIAAPRRARAPEGRPSARRTFQSIPRRSPRSSGRADMQITPDGRFVYVSERTTSRLIAYRVQPDGSLEYASFIETETQPRGFRIDPAGPLPRRVRGKVVACRGVCHRRRLRRSFAAFALRRRAGRELG